MKMKTVMETSDHYNHMVGRRLRGEIGGGRFWGGEIGGEMGGVE